jgi:hypothetical protein
MASSKNVALGDQSDGMSTLIDHDARSRDVRQKIEYLRGLWLAAQARPRSLSGVRTISYARQQARVREHQEENDN